MMLDRIDHLLEPFAKCAATAGLALSMVLTAAGPGWPQAAPPSLGVQSPAQQSAPNQALPRQAEPPSAPPPAQESPGLIDEIGKLFEKSKSMLPTLKSPG